MEEKVYLTLLNGTGYVFDIDDYMRLRKEHRIVGCLVGTNNERGSTSNENRLPAELSIFETRLLIEKGFAELISKKQSFLKCPTTTEIQSATEELNASIIEQAEYAKAEKLRISELNIEKILTGKRKKLEKEGAIEAAKALTSTEVLKEIGENFSFEHDNALQEIHCAHSKQHVAFIVRLPTLSPYDELKYRVFCDFWMRGKFVTSGDAFSSDFLIYPGDPLLYHATHIVVVLEEPKKVKALELIAKSRVSIIVNKICVFAYSKGTDDEIHYQTIEWDGHSEPEIAIIDLTASVEMDTN